MKWFAIMLLFAGCSADAGGSPALGVGVPASEGDGFSGAAGGSMRVTRVGPSAPDQDPGSVVLAAAGASSPSPVSRGSSGAPAGQAGGSPVVARGTGGASGSPGAATGGAQASGGSGGGAGVPGASGGSSGAAEGGEGGSSSGGSPAGGSGPSGGSGGEQGSAGTSGTDGGRYPGEIDCPSAHSGYAGDCHRWACIACTPEQPCSGGATSLYVVVSVIDDTQMAPVCGGGESYCCKNGAGAQDPSCCM